MLVVAAAWLLTATTEAQDSSLADGGSDLPSEGSTSEVDAGATLDAAPAQALLPSETPPLSAEHIELEPEAPLVAAPAIMASPANGRAKSGAAPHQIVEVNASGLSEGLVLRESAQAVQVIETERAQRESADLGEVLARSQGIGMRRSGGLGSASQLSLNGFNGDQVRFFIDGIPLELAGYPFGIANVPVNVVQRVDVYRGVVPIRFGADALGGAVNLVSEGAAEGSHGAASYQIGSFETHRATLRVSHADAASGLFAEGSGFFDKTANNYFVDVEAGEDDGGSTPVRVRRFHDAYQAGSGNLAFGVVNRPWAKQLAVRTFLTKYLKELQNDLTMKQVYGDVRYGERVAGTNVSFQNDYGRRVSVDALAGYTRTWRKFIDTEECFYSWYGECIGSSEPGEIEDIPHDQHWDDHATFARLSGVYRFTPEHELRLAVSPNYLSRQGEERRGEDLDERDPLSARRNLLSLVSGLEYTTRFFDDRLENVLFVKDYLQIQDAEERVAGGTFIPHERTEHLNGIGNGLKYTFDNNMTIKASYEWATRLPRPDELFGDGVRIAANLGLVPERSHNLNLGLALSDAQTNVGSWRFDTNGFMRMAEQLIEALPFNQNQIAYQNVTQASSLGIEASAGWTSPGSYLALDGNMTYLDFRNDSTSGDYAMYEGDRIPNMPYLFGSGSARGQLHDVAFARDELSLSFTSRYVHEFYRNWERAGSQAGIPKAFTPEQLTHSAGLTYLLRSERSAGVTEPTTLTFTVEVQNLTDARVYDFYGIQRPGRAAFCKVTAEL